MPIGPTYHTHFYVCTLTSSRCVGCGHIEGEPEMPWQHEIILSMAIWQGFEDQFTSETPIFDRLKNEMGLIWPEKDLN